MNIIGNKRIDFDFHIHTLPGSPDARQTVKEAIETAIEAGLNTIAITDHNSVDSLDEAIKLSKEYNINLICGVELSVNLTGLNKKLEDEVIHVLGLGINPNKDLFASVTNHTFESRDKWLNEIKESLEQEFNVKLNAKYEGTLYKELVTLNLFKDRNEAKKFIKTYKVDSIKKYKPIDVSEVVDMIHSLGGIAILAHPNRGENHRVFELNEIETIIDYLVSKGLDGIELYHPNVVEDVEVFNKVNQLINKYNLLTSLGVDRHNSFNYYGDYYYRQNEFITNCDVDFSKVKCECLNRINGNA